jgi:hypothetical protein
MASKTRPDRETAPVFRHPKAGREQTAHVMLGLAALLLLVSGVSNAIVGLGLLVDEAFASRLTPFVSIAAWGRLLVLVGAAKIVAGIGLLGQRFWAALVAMVFASLSLLAHMALLSS